MTELLTTKQVQEMLQVDRTTIYRMAESNRLPAIRVGKQWRFSRPEIERWLHAPEATLLSELPAPHPADLAAGTAAPAAVTLPVPSKLALRELLPQTCTQLIQEAFAEILGVMMVITDMQGQPVTAVSNPCGFYTALTRDPEAILQCMRAWQQMAASPAMEPKFFPSEMGLLCARGLIRLGSELKGMVVIGGIAPEVWPPSLEHFTSLAETFGVSVNEVEAHANGVYWLDQAAQERALRSVQRVADIVSHIVEDRYTLRGRLQAIAALTVL